MKTEGSGASGWKCASEKFQGPRKFLAGVEILPVGEGLSAISFNGMQPHVQTSSTTMYRPSVILGDEKEITYH